MHVIQMVVVVALSISLTSDARASTTFSTGAQFSKVGESVGGRYGPGHHLAIDGSTVYAVNVRTISGEAQIGLTLSSNGGGTWQATRILQSGPNLDEAVIALGPDPQSPGNSVIHVVWTDRDPTTGNGTLYYCSRSTSGGSRWTAPTALIGSGDNMVAYTADLVANSLGKMNVLIDNTFPSSVAYFTKEQ